MGSEDRRTERERWLDRAAHSEWTFKAYYKYSFTFTSSGTLLWLPNGGTREFTATASVGGDADDIYRYSVVAHPMAWSEVCAAGEPYLTVIATDGDLLFSADPDRTAP
jgi:hypothetical protein